MPGFDERMKQHLGRLAPPADPSGAFDRILEKKIRRRLMRRFEAGALAVVVVAATVGGTFALVRFFRSNGETERPGGINPTPVPVKNGLIAYASLQSGNYDIWTAEPDGAKADNITADSLSADTVPAWSPDGTRIAFMSKRDGNPEIYLMNPQGAGVTRLTRNPGMDAQPAWSPDGTKIAYVADDGLFVMNADGSEVHRLTSQSGRFEIHPSWAPDGSKIVFSRLVPRHCPAPGEGCKDFSAIYVIHADGSGITKLTEGPDGSAGVDYWPDWSPDGTKIAFARAGDIYVMNNDGSGLRKLTDNQNGPSSSDQPTWSPDGKKILFVRTSAGKRSAEVYTMNADGSGLTSTGLPGRLTTVIAPDWQPIPLSASPTPPATLTPSPTSSPLPAKCDASQVTGDFDGNGQPDTATVAKTECFVEPGDLGERFSAEYSLQVRWAPSEGVAPLPDCGNVCKALAATDLNLDGIDEFILKVDEGSSTYIIQIYELPTSESFGDPARMAPPGGPGFPPDQAAQFVVGGSVTAYAALGCMPGNNEIIVEIAKLDSKQTEYVVHKTVLRFDPIDGPPFGQFTVISADDYTEPFDTEIGPGDRFEPGGPCWTE